MYSTVLSFWVVQLNKQGYQRACLPSNFETGVLITVLGCKSTRESKGV